MIIDNMMDTERYINGEEEDTKVVSRNVPPIVRRATMSDLPPIRQNEWDFLWNLYHTLNMPSYTNNGKSSSNTLNNINWFQTEPTSNRFQQQQSREEDYDYRDSAEDYCNFVGIDCNSKGLVSTLNISNWGLSGYLPSSFLPLSKLQYLILKNNNIRGNLPNLIPTSLIHLDVSNNQISGLLSRTTFSLAAQNLQRINLSNNQLSGTIPGEYNLCNLLDLTTLDLSNNTLINGTLPDCFATELRDLHELKLRNTNLIGPVPEQLCNISSIPSSSNEGGNQNELGSGLCVPFGFCTAGYREVFASGPPDSNKNYTTAMRCQPCDVRSNRISSSVCEELTMGFESSSPPPPLYAVSEMITSMPLSSLLPAETVPSESPIFVPTSSPTVQSQLHDYDRPSSSPFSLFDPEIHSPVDLHHGAVSGIQKDDSASSLRLGRGLVALVIGILLVLAILLISVRSWRIRRKVRRLKSFLTLSDIHNVEGNHNGDEEEPSFELPNESKQSIDSTGEQPLPSSFVVQRRPCIVRPATLSSQPKVRFFLGPRPSTTFGGVKESNHDEEIHFNHADPQGLALLYGPSSSSLDNSNVIMPSFDSESAFPECSMSLCKQNSCTINGEKIKATNEMVIPSSRCPPYRVASLISKPSVDSSLSSTTPMLNSLDDDDDVRIGAVPWLVKFGPSGKPQDEAEDCYNKVMPLVKDGLSSSCTMNKSNCEGTNEMRDDHEQHPNATPSSPPHQPESFRGQHDVFEGYQSLLGILPSSVTLNCTQQDEDDDGVEIIEFYGEDENVGIPFEAPDEESFEDEARIGRFYYS